MGVLTATVAKGKALFEGVVLNYKTHDPASDNMYAAGAYSHDPLRGSATEFDDVTSLELFLAALAKAGGGAINVRNATGGALNNGPIRVSGYYADDANGFPIFKIVAADAATNTFANALLLTALADATTGVAYVAGDFTPSPALNLSLSAVGDPVYLAAGGGMTRTAPTGADQLVQEIGKVKTVNATGVVAGFIKPPQLIGSTFYQPASVTFPALDVSVILAARMFE